MVPVGREVSNSLPLLVSPHFDELLTSLSKKADYVIVDAPPLGAIIDAAEIAKSCDGTLIVVNYDSVRRQELINVKEQLEQTECPILGTVLNMVKFDNYLSKKYYYKSYYSYGYSAYDKTRIAEEYSLRQRVNDEFSDIHSHFVYGMDDGADGAGHEGHADKL